MMALCVNNVQAQTEERRMLSIEELFSLADSNNLTIREFTVSVDMAEENVKVAKNSFLPSVNASLSLGYNGNGMITDRNFSHSFVAPIPHFGNNFAVEVSQVIFAGGAIRNGLKIAELQSQLAALNAESNRQEVRFLIAGNYLELCKLQNQLQILESHIAQTQKMLKNMHVRVNEGAALQNDITRYELQLQNLHYAKIQLQNAMYLLNSQLVTAAGLPKSVVIETASSLHSPSTRDGEIPPRLSGERALSVQMAEKAEKMAEHAEKITRAERLPHIALFAGDYLNGPVTIEIPALNKNFNYWAVGVGVKYNLDNFYKSGTKIRVSQLAARRATAEKAVAEEHAALAIEAAQVHYGEAFALLETKEKSEELAVQNYNVIAYRYENDLALITDLLDAASQKLDAELQAINARINIVYNYYKIKYISGTL
ncbi:transporter [Bacteroidia bacterium]|nr:transporter [Bacteroidia bacterium]